MITTKLQISFHRRIVKFCVLVLIPILFLLLPFFFVSFPPATDLPQHLSQIYLLGQTLKGNTGLYSINWFGPNNLIYLFLILFTYLFSPPFSGKFCLIILVLLWAGSIYFLAWKRKRPLENTILALLFIYNLSFYWGFLNFLIGLPFFILWIIQSLKPINKRNWSYLTLISFLLYCSHALWFFMGSVWLFFCAILHWKNLKTFLYRLSTIIPIGFISIIWYKFLASARGEAGFDIAPHWFNSPIHRIFPNYFVNSMLGGIRGNVEPIIVLAVLGWIFLAFISNRQGFKKKIDVPIFLCAIFFTVVMLLGPEKYMNTIFFSQRWFPIAIILFIISMPVPAINRTLLRTAMLLLLMVFSFRTASAWYLFQQRELSGLSDSLKLLPENQKVLGLDFVKTSKYLKGRPFLQVFSYSQVFKGGDLNFSFAEHASGIVQYKKIRVLHWTPGLEWFAERVTQRDFLAFDYALINGDLKIHSESASFQFLKPVTLHGRWRLYKIVH